MITLHPLPEPKRRAPQSAPRPLNDKVTREGKPAAARDPGRDERHPCACRGSDACS